MLSCLLLNPEVADNLLFFGLWLDNHRAVYHICEFPWVFSPPAPVCDVLSPVCVSLFSAFSASGQPAILHLGLTLLQYGFMLVDYSYKV